LELGHNARFLFGHLGSGYSLFLLKLGHNACLLLRIGNDTSSGFDSAGFGFSPIAFSNQSPHRSATLNLLLAQDDPSAKAFRRVLSDLRLSGNLCCGSGSLLIHSLRLQTTTFSVAETCSGRANRSSFTKIGLCDSTDCGDRSASLCGGGLQRRSIDSADIATINRPSSKTTKVILKLLIQTSLSESIRPSSDTRLDSSDHAASSSASNSSLKNPSRCL
jgi:hypothetical protein